MANVSAQVQDAYTTHVLIPRRVQDRIEQLCRSIVHQENITSAILLADRLIESQQQRLHVLPIVKDGDQHDQRKTHPQTSVTPLSVYLPITREDTASPF